MRRTRQLSRLVVCVATFVALVACSDDGGPTSAGGAGGISSLPSASRSGARLTARFHAVGAAAERFVDFLDTKLDLHCSFRLAGDAVPRCLPDATLAAGDVFADVACTARLATFGKKACGVPKFVEATAGCPESSRLFAIGPEAKPSVVYSVSTTGECIAQASDSETVYYELGAEVPPTDFVEGRTKPATEARLTTVLLDGNDGSRTFLGFRDARNDQDCVPATMVDGSKRCVPKVAAFVDPNLFADSSCSVRAAAFGSCGAPTAAIEADTCSARTRVFAVGDKSTTPHQASGGKCSPGGASAIVYAVLAELDSQELATIEPVPEFSGFRVVPRQLRAAGGPITVGFADTAKNTECSPALAEDGKLRCLPVALGPAHFFRDAACSAPVVPWTCGGAPPDFAFEYVDANVACDRSVRVRVRGGEVPLAELYYRFPGGECVRRAQPANARFFAVGAPVAASEFVEVSVISH